MNATRVYSNTGNRALLKLLPPGAVRVLDVGCGSGDNARLLAERGCRVVGITLSACEAQAASVFCERVIVKNVESDVLDIEEEGFDVVLLSHVLEHLVEPGHAIKRLARFVRSGGVALAAVPNMAFWRVRLRHLRGDWTRDSVGFMDDTHLQFWSYRTATSVFEGSPFKVRRVLPGDPSVPLWPVRRLAPMVARATDRAIGPLFPNLLAVQVLLQADKIGENR